MVNENSGINIGGSARVQIGAAAAGENAQATVYRIDSGTRDEVGARLQDILTELRRLVPQDPGLQKAVDTAESLDQELRADAPDSGKVKTLLRNLGAGVERIGELARAVTSIEAILRLPG